MKTYEKNEKKRKKQAGFTLIELLVVITIIGILGAVVAPRLIGQTEKAKEGAVIAEVKNLQLLADTYHLNKGKPISSLQDLVPEYADEVPEGDPWGDAYTLTTKGDGSVRISSPGYEKSKEKQKETSTAASANVNI